MPLYFPESAIAPEVVQPAVRYRALSRTAVASFVLGALSIVVFLSWFLAMLPLAAIALGIAALRRIRWTPEELTGRELARAGILLAVGFWLGGYLWLALSWSNEAPWGYERIEYSALQPDWKAGEKVAHKAQELEDQLVYVKGYMSPTRQQTKLRKFILCPTNGVCQFCNPNPRPTEMIRVRMVGDQTADFTNHLIGIGGKFHYDAEDRAAPYSMDVDYIR
ncbi:MAG: DUF4190 domain-containing protein [Thermoguttaceae bacterium]|jgi:hypothetical protein